MKHAHGSIHLLYRVNQERAQSPCLRITTTFSVVLYGCENNSLTRVSWERHTSVPRSALEQLLIFEKKWKKNGRNTSPGQSRWPRQAQPTPCPRCRSLGSGLGDTRCSLKQMGNPRGAHQATQTVLWFCHKFLWNPPWWLQQDPQKPQLQRWEKFLKN